MRKIGLVLTGNGRFHKGKYLLQTVCSQPIIKTQQSCVADLPDTVCWFLLKLPFNVQKLFVKYIPFTISVITHADDKGKDRQDEILTEKRCRATIQGGNSCRSTIHAFFPFILRPSSVILSAILTKRKVYCLAHHTLNPANSRLKKRNSKDTYVRLPN